MAFGDVGGAVTELILTCRTEQGLVDIKKGDAVCLVGPYTVSNTSDGCGYIFGQALAATTRKGEPIPVKVRGVARFSYVGEPLPPDGRSGVALSSQFGKVAMNYGGNFRGPV